jgi:hypothetical protein
MALRPPRGVARTLKVTPSGSTDQGKPLEAEALPLR